MTNYIQSIQPFSITIASGSTSNTATITSVNTANAVIFFDGCQTTDTACNGALGRCTLTNATTVTATRNTGNATTCTVKGTVVEFISAAVNVAVQYGTITLAAGAASNTATITSVTTANASLFYLGFTTSASGAISNSVYTNVELTNSTTVTAARSSTSGSTTIAFCVIEWTTSVVKSSQHRSVSLSTNATAPTDTITSVTTGNTLLLYGGVSSAVSAENSSLHYLSLTNGTTVTLTRTGVSTSTRVVKYDVLEFQAGILNSNVQRGTITLNNVTSNTATITAVTTSQSVVNHCNMNTAESTATALNQFLCTAVLTDATTVTANVNSADANAAILSYEVAEFATGGAPPAASRRPDFMSFFGA